MRQPLYSDLEDVKGWGPWRPREEGPIWEREQKVQRRWSWDKVCLACYGRNSRKIWMARQRWKREGGVETGWYLSQFNILLPYWVMCKYWGVHITPKWEGASNLHVMYLILQPCWLFPLSPPHSDFQLYCWLLMPHLCPLQMPGSPWFSDLRESVGGHLSA